MKRSAFSLLIAAGLISAWPQPSCATNWQPGDLVTFTQTDWALNSAAAALLRANWDTVYTSNDNYALNVGIGFSILWTSPGTVLNYFPTSGAPVPLTGSYVDPTTTSTGVFGGDVTALQLDVDFADAGFLLGNSGIPFGNLVVTQLRGSIANLNGQTVRQVLVQASIALGGGPTPYPIDDLDAMIAQLTFAFDAGVVSSYAQAHLVAPEITTRNVTTLDETGPGSIRDIFFQSSPGDTINFAVTGPITLSSGPIPISRSLHIVGPGARSLTISGSANRVFVVTGGTSTISGLTIANGNNTDYSNDGSAAQGGAIYVSNPAMLTITDCAFNNNAVLGATNSTSGGNGGAGQGGAIYNGGTLTLTGCIFTGNSATGNAGTSHGVVGNGGTGGAGQGGALFNDTSGNLSVTNCTFNGNTATGGASGSGGVPTTGGKADGGAIYNQGTLTTTSVTVGGNTGTGGAGGKGGKVTGATGGSNGGVSSGGGVSTVGNTIIAGNSASTSPDVEGGFTSSGHNLIGIVNGSTGFTAAGDQTGSANIPLNPQLGALTNNGGQTNTMALQSTSTAINAGNTGLAPRRDQRGNFRNGAADIGAFEYNGELVGLSSIARTGTNDATIGAEVVIGHTYQLQRKINITDTSWMNVGNAFIATGNDSESATDSHGFSMTRAFYHVTATQ
jgi:hypothetical protein